MVKTTLWGSKQALYQGIAQHPCGLYVWPELSAVLKTLGDRSFAGVKEWLTDRYDSPGTPDKIAYRETGKASDTPAIVFDRAPRLSILSTSSFDWFTSNLVTEDATGGFVPRWMIFRMNAAGKLIPRPMKPDTSLLDCLAERLNAAKKLEGPVDISAVAEQYDAWYIATNERFSSHSNNTLAKPFFNRHRTHFLKLAALYEVSRSGTLAVSTASMRRAAKTAKQLEATIFDLLQTGFNSQGAGVTQFLEFIKQKGAIGISTSAMTRVFQYINPSERRDRLSTLEDSGDVVRFSKETGGRRACVFVHREYASQHQKEFPNEERI